MNRDMIVSSTLEFVKGRLSGEGSGHDWWHTLRVYNSALQIAKEEVKADIFIVQLGALLHDISDWKFNDGDHSAGVGIAKAWLENNEADPISIKHVEDIITDISFRGAKELSPMKTIEGEIVQDADRLDAIGAIGIARAFAYGGFAKREIYNPNIKPALHDNFEQYKRSVGTTINHFYEKLLLLKNMMNTESAKRRAERRHLFLENYLNEFFEEWNGTI